MTEYNLFCWAENYNDENSFQQKRYRAFNGEVGEKRYYEILLVVKEILKDLKLELNKNSWIEEWKKVTSEQWNEILSIPEANKEIIEKIIGFEIKGNDVNDDVEIIVDGKKIMISRKSAKALNLLT